MLKHSTQKSPSSTNQQEQKTSRFSYPQVQNQQNTGLTLEDNTSNYTMHPAPLVVGNNLLSGINKSEGSNTIQKVENALDEAFLQNEDRLLQQGIIPRTFTNPSIIKYYKNLGFVIENKQIKREEIPSFEQIQQAARKPDYKKVLELYDFNWFNAKEHLAYITYAKDDNEYDARLQIMRKLIKYRDDEVDTILIETLIQISKKIVENQQKGSIKPTFKDNDPKKDKTGWEIEVDGIKLIASAPGSQAETSDYDITFIIPGYEEMEVDAVKYFNESFRKNWEGKESGVVFDTNVYTSGFMSDPAQKDYKTNLTNKRKENFKKAKHRTQMALSFLPIRQYFADKNQEKWSDFKEKTKKTLTEYLNKNLRNEQQKENVVKAAMIDLDNIFNLTGVFYNETSRKLEKGINELKVRNNNLSHEHIKAIVGDKLYEKQLEKVKKLLLERKQIIGNINKLNNSGLGALKLYILRNKLANNLIEFEQSQGKALVFANEAYYNAGAAIHVVKGMQSGGKINLGRQKQMQSLLMNIGYKLQHFEHHYHEVGMGRALLNTAKYGQRIRDIITRKDGNLLKAGFDPELYKLLEDDIALLDAEEKLINDYKKKNEFKTPAEKEAAAQYDFKPERKLSRRNIEESYIKMAQKILSPFYLDKFQKRKGFWGN